MPDQNCPLCGGPATFALVDFGRAKRIQCAVCKTFVVYPDVERLIAEAPRPNREAMSKAASALSDEFVLLISITADTKDPSGRAKQTLGWDSEPADKWQ